MTQIGFQCRRCKGLFADDEEQTYFICDKCTQKYDKDITSYENDYKDYLRDVSGDEGFDIKMVEDFDDWLDSEIEMEKDDEKNYKKNRNL